jgi:hypothetical protein
MKISNVPNGRSIELVQYRFKGTYSSFIEGSRDSASRYIRENIEEIAEGILSPCKPLNVVWPSEYILPRWIFVGEFAITLKDKHVQKMDTAIQPFFLCWFAEDIPDDVNNIVESDIPRLDWEKIMN